MIVVKRGAGDKKGGTISSNVLTDIPSQVNRGRTAINDSSDRDSVTCVPIFPEGGLPYQYVTIHKTNKTLYGRIRTVSIQARHADVNVNFIAEVPK